MLAAATIALYSPVIGYSFVVLDDHDYVTANPHIQGDAAWSTIKWAFTSTDAANWHPLTWLSHALDYQLFALNPAGHHFDSVLIHALNAVLLFLLLAWVTKRVGPSLLVAALFAVHPLNVESVAWVAERKNVLSTLFFFLAIAAYAWYAQKPDWRRYLLVAALFAAGLMAKPMVITLPFVLLLLDYWPLERTAEQSGLPPSARRKWQFSRLVLEKVPLLVLSAASAWITLKAQRSGHAVRTFESVSARAFESRMPSWPTGYICGRCSGRRGLASLSPFRNRAPGVAMDFVCAGFDRHHRVRCCLSPQALLAGGMVLVSGYFGSGHRPGAGGRGRHGGPLCLYPADRNLRNDCLGLDDWAEARKFALSGAWFRHCACWRRWASSPTRQMSYWESEYDLWSHTLAVARKSIAHDALVLR